MNYINIIKTAIFTFPIIAFLFTIPFIIHQYHKYGAINKLRVFIIYSFILYLITVYFLVILPLPSMEEVASMTTKTVQLIPFSFIKDIMDSDFNLFLLSSYSNPIIYTTLFNIIMTIPFGMYLRYYYKCSFKKTMGYTFLFSLFLELTQLSGLYGIYPRAYRVFDVDDLITNTFGGVLGYLFMGLLNKYLPSREKIDLDTLESSKKVSGLRRITVFGLDMFIYLILLLFLMIFFHNRYLYIYLFVIYYIVIPIIWNGKTIGSNFLKVRVSFPNMKFIRLIIRQVFYYLYYFLIPLYWVLFNMFIVETFEVAANLAIGLYLIGFIIIIIFYMFNIIFLLKNGTLFYDKLYKITYISTTLDNLSIDA